MWFRQASTNRSIEELHTVIGQLEGLAASTEGEFLALGEGLQRFHGQSRDIADWSAAITARMTGDEIAQAMDGLRRIFSRVKALDDGSRQDSENMRLILSRIDEMQHSLAGFGRIVRNLLVLCSFIRIESARMAAHHKTGFLTLSDDVSSLALLIETKSAQLLDQSMRLSGILRENMGDIASFEAGKHGHALSILDSAARCLNAMTGKHSFSAAALKEIADRSEGIAQSIGEVVSSLQFHDITRQRIEHALEALREVARERSEGSMNGGIRRLKGLRIFADKGMGKGGPGSSGKNLALLQTCEIQRAQLESARHEIVAAVERIMGSLSRIAGHVDEMGDDTRNLLNAADPSGDSFLSSLDRGFSSLGAAMAEYQRIHSELSATIDHTAGAIGSMSTFIKEIEAIGTKIQLIALNASIRAAHAGSEGEALGVMAEAIRQLSTDTSRQTEIISESLRMVIGSAGEWTKGVQQKMQGGDDDRMGDSISIMMKALRKIDEETRDILGRINDRGKSLSDGIAATLQGIRVHERFDGEINDVTAVLKNLAMELQTHLTDGERTGRTAALEGLEDRYTMNSERAIHQAVVRTAVAVAASGIADLAVPAPGGKAGELESAEEDLGENVELF